MSVFQDILIFSGSGFFIICLTIGILNVLMKGFPMAYLGVKASRGKKILLRIHSITGKYYRGAKIIDSTTIRFKTKNNKNNIETGIDKSCVWDELGVKGVDYNEQTAQIIQQTNFSAIAASDPNETDNLLTRALTGPQLMDKKELIIIILGVLNILATAAVIYLVLNLEKIIKGIQLVGRV